MTARLPHPLELVMDRGWLVFTAPRSANLVAVRGPGKAGDWDGVLYLAWVDTDGAGWTIHAWPCATRPGRVFLERPMNPLGTAVLEPGQYRKSHRQGLHKGRPALVQVGPVTVRRDGDQDALVEPGRQTYNGLFGVNIHDVTSPDHLAGCIGLSPLHTAHLLRAFSSLTATQGQDVTLTLVTG
jgi:hypothetical protein